MNAKNNITISLKFWEQNDFEPIILYSDYQSCMKTKTLSDMGRLRNFILHWFFLKKYLKLDVKGWEEKNSWNKKTSIQHIVESKISIIWKYFHDSYSVEGLKQSVQIMGLQEECLQHCNKSNVNFL